MYGTLGLHDRATYDRRLLAVHVGSHRKLNTGDDAARQKLFPTSGPSGGEALHDTLDPFLALT